MRNPECHRIEDAVINRFVHPAPFRVVGRRGKAGRLSAPSVALLALLSLLALLPASAQNSRCVTLNCPTNVMVECTSPQGTPVTYAPTAQTICGTSVDIVCTPPSGSLFPAGTNSVLCVATDNTGAVARCEFLVIVRDTTPPVLTTPASIATNCASASGRAIEFAVSATDNCDSTLRVVSSPPSGSVFPVGTTEVRCVVADSAGNASTNTFNVTVTGECPDLCLEIACPEDIVVTLGQTLPLVDGQPFPGAYVDYDVTATDTCTGEEVPVQCTPPSGSLFEVGIHTVTALAVEDGYRKTCSFRVIVKDVAPPSLFAPLRGVSAPCQETLGDGTKGARVNFTVQATDNVDARPRISCDPPSGSFFPIGTNTVVCVAMDSSGNATTNSFTVSVYMSRACLLATLEDMPDNWGFELGLTAWEAEGDAFADQPVEGDVMPVKRVKKLKDQLENDIGGDYWHDVTFPVGHQGDHWVGTAENIYNLGGLFDDSPTDARTGTLRSKSFVIGKPHISFLIGGTHDPERVRVELLVQTDAPGTGTVNYDGLNYQMVHHRTADNLEIMAWAWFNVQELVGKRAILRIVDQSPTGHLNVDHFQFHDLPLADQTVTIGGKTYPAWFVQNFSVYRWDSPVWGFADLHTHPMSYLGFGGFVMHGEPDGDIQEALHNCRCSHGGWGWDNQCGDYLREIVMAVMDGAGPAPHYNDYNDGHPYNPIAEFNTWPVFWTITHQQMWHEWMKRTYQGGQRVIVALCVNNPLLAVGTKGLLPRDDKWVGDTQIAALKEFVARHNDFMEIAYDPFQLRDIVRRDKLAVIIGSELDDIGNFAWDRSVNPDAPSETDKEKVRAEIQRVYDLGMRYIFPVHLMNNSFGGTAIGDDMLNVANRYLNHEAFEAEPAGPDENINFYLGDLDFTEEAVAISLAAPAAPAILPALLPVADALLASQGVPPGVAAGTGAGILPLGLLGLPLLPVVGIEIGEAGIPLEVLPIAGNYPYYPQKSDGCLHGHKNARGLTPLGKFAISEMMKLGMMIDIDHMSQKVVEEVLQMAEQNPVGYPLNSGHNSPRDLGLHRGENSRTLTQLDRIQKLGGIFGVGYENGESGTFATTWPARQYTESQIENDCAGTSKTFAQYYLYGVEAMRGRGVAFGTDINGLIPGPGPRFGPQSAFALPDQDARRYDQLRLQGNGVRYTPEHGRPIATPVFVGKGIDPAVNMGYPRTQLGYRYNFEQGDLFASIRLYYWRRQQVQNGLTEAELVADLNNAVNAMHGAYPNKGRVLLYALGLLKGIHNWAPTSDLDSEVYNLQLLGKALYKTEVLGQAPPDEVWNSSALKPRYQRAVTVWKDYHDAFGSHAPLKRCTTGYKQWDINFEGVAHYGLIPDFLQDLHNVGMKPKDLSVLFRSAEHFAQMWTRTLDAAWWMTPHFFDLSPLIDPGTGSRSIRISFTTDGDAYDVEESDNLDPQSWLPARVEEVSTQGNLRTVKVTAAGPAKFYRLRKR